MWQINGIQASLCLPLPLPLSLSAHMETHRVGKLNVILRNREWKQATENENKL